MNIWTFDLGLQTGIAMGHPPERLNQLNSMTVDLRTHPTLDNLVTDCMRLARNLERYLLDAMAFKHTWPDRVFYEAPHDPHYRPKIGGKELPRNSISIILPWILACKVEEFFEERNIPVQKVHPNSVRPTFIGSTGTGNREDTKTVIIRRCKEYGYLPEHLDEKKKPNNDRADAIALWHWAQIKHGGWQPPVEFLFNKKINVIGGTR